VSASRPTASPNQMAPKPSSSNSAVASCIWVAGNVSNCVVQIPTDPSCIDDCANAQILCRREQYPYAGSSIGDPERPYATSFGRTGNRSRASPLKRSPPVSDPGPRRLPTNPFLCGSSLIPCSFPKLRKTEVFVNPCISAIQHLRPLRGARKLTCYGHPTARATSPSSRIIHNTSECSRTRCWPPTWDWRSACPCHKRK